MAERVVNVLQHRAQAQRRGSTAAITTVVDWSMGNEPAISISGRGADRLPHTMTTRSAGPG